MQSQARQQDALEPLMPIPLADVPRWYAERKPKDTVAVSHGDDAISSEQSRPKQVEISSSDILK